MAVQRPLLVIVCLIPLATSLAPSPLARRLPRGRVRHHATQPTLSRLQDWRVRAHPRCAFNIGVPSTPGWAGGRLNRLTDWAVANQTNRPIICEYKADGVWLWSKWRGTVLSITLLPVLLTMCIGVAVDTAVTSMAATTWPLLAVPPKDDQLIEQLNGLNTLWEYQLTLSTFILTFFTSQAYSHWRSVYFTTRAIQGRIKDACLLLAMAAERDETCPLESGGEGGSCTRYTAEASDLLVRCTRLLRLSHTFFWAATPTCSNGVGDGGIEDGDGQDDIPREWRRDDAIGPLLLSPEGLERLVAKGELTAEEADALLLSGLPPSQYTYTLLEWAGMYAMRGLQAGRLRGGPGFEEQLLQQFTRLRAEMFNIGDFTAGRMPLAYVQLVQVLIDSLVVLAPLALYPEAGSLSIPLTGLLTLFFKGLLELSNSFLDPFGVEGYPGQNIRVDVLVSELNFGAASRWVKAGQALPLPPEPR